MFSGPAGSGPRGSLRPNEDSGPPSPGQALNLPAPTDMDDLLQNGKGGVLKAVVDAANSRAPESVFLKEETVQYGPVVTRPEKIIMMGFNYRRHAEETNTPIPKNPVLFNKYNNALNYHGGTIKLPTEAAKQFDYEVELVIVMGKKSETSPRPTPSTMWR